MNDDLDELEEMARNLLHAISYGQFLDVESAAENLAATVLEYTAALRSV